MDLGNGYYLNLGAQVGVMGNTISTGTNAINQSLARLGYGATFGRATENDIWGIGLYSTAYSSTDGTSQRVGGAGFGYNKFNVRYENDGAWPKAIQGLIASGTDGYRTAAVNIGYGDFSLRLNMFTGMNRTGRVNKDYKPHGIYEGGDVDQYRFGALSVGYKNYRIGTNSENIRDLFQNRIVHRISGDPYFKKLDNIWHLFFYYGTTDRYGLW